ncbi:putative exoribonuclease II [Arabidopsis thaliana]|uniref:Protein REGULATOR OF FATTY ACID COMPOSITION 3, chloroplastic n=4 Tax=Arabidopsis TaxID=3701 RepID=RFAC3_ARATH|nr:Translation elongation factor EF1B/ribosomal protein S6 family protein [Arabidopsis thaliana]Q948R9.1 RecName: Full=Protein REGULATOR OF FATTY ACID COMPOSITION 3, chloroplastic; Flags: Precursor [Arabidopsis thaliana]KAG7625556.1 Ribosomal protein S6 [Arabidopsis thaliana x Arabidopsis arenosa]KAG7631563.1 Ribosomal protein S6 [Arabidopsis suecica]AAL67119.1 AT3g17170/K14A17_29 [Arabidopsis thaliana]AAM26661.1 AT3g17170/K14A17_29 [Arabidopsis thaliana]AEE75914.1 Translation elongation fact|eukprot:NP_566568.1 Translation elongation factor EF1B/ribosomal protein S6 family protein [Arabidopsis thaliana]
MESLLHASSSLVSLRPRIDGRDSFINPSRVCLNPSLGRRGSKPLPLVAAAKKKKSKKDDNHNFSARPDEATGPFPESILLKEKKIDEEGDLLPEFADAEEKELYQFLDLQLQSDLNEERMRHYEVVYLIHEKHAEEVESINQKVQDYLKEKKGKVWRFSDWGMRRLAYKIQKAENAHYILMNFEIEAKYLNEFKGLLDSDERVIRHLVMKRDEAITEDCPPPPEFHSVRAGDEYYDDDEEEEIEEDEDEGEGEDEEDADNIEYEVDDDGNVVMVLYGDEEEGEEEEDGASEQEEGQDKSTNGRRETRRTVNVGG